MKTFLVIFLWVSSLSFAGPLDGIFNRVSRTAKSECAIWMNVLAREIRHSAHRIKFLLREPPIPPRQAGAEPELEGTVRYMVATWGLLEEYGLPESGPQPPVRMKESYFLGTSQELIDLFRDIRKFRAVEPEFVEGYIPINYRESYYYKRKQHNTQVNPETQDVKQEYGEGK